MPLCEMWSMRRLRPWLMYGRPQMTPTVQMLFFQQLCVSICVFCVDDCQHSANSAIFKGFVCTTRWKIHERSENLQSYYAFECGLILINLTLLSKLQQVDEEAQMWSS